MRTWWWYSVDWRFGTTLYHIEVSNPSGRSSGVGSAELDGEPVDAARIPLAHDGGRHEIRVTLGNAPNGKAPRSDQAAAARALS